MDTVLDLTVERAVAGGRMLARHEGAVVLVAGAIPGERVRARVDRVSRGTTWATVVDVIDASPDRRAPRCDPACGGSAYAHVRYERQTGLKGEVVADALRRIGRLALDAPVRVAASPDAGYRLRARLHVAGHRAGFFREGSHALCDPAPTGQLLPETLTAVAALIERLDRRVAECAEIVVAENVRADERVLHLVPRAGARLDDLVGHLGCPDAVTGVTTERGGLVAIAGRPAVTDAAADVFGPEGPASLRGAVWSRRPTTFFQGNRYLTGALVRRVVELAAGERFVDLYAGVGLFAVALATRGARGLAVEGDPAGAADLTNNAAPLGDRLKVMSGAVEDAVRLRLDPAPDVVVVDPPRTGVSPAALAGLVAWRTPLVVYVSCDPATFARDAARLVAAGYRLASIDGFDLFPNTPHVEVVAAFTRAGGADGPRPPQ